LNIKVTPIIRLFRHVVMCKMQNLAVAGYPGTLTLSQFSLNNVVPSL